MIGQTKTAGYQFGLRKTLPVPSHKLWKFITSAEANELLTGNPEQGIEEQVEKEIDGGSVTYKVTTLVNQSHFRMQWKKNSWDQYSVLQVRVIPEKHGKATLAIHQEKLEDHVAREEMKEHWQDVMKKLEILAIASLYDF